MTWPIVGVNQINQLQGETNEVERCVLFVGKGAVNVGKTLAVNTQSDFDKLLGESDSQLKSDVMAAVSNAGQNWWGFIHVLAVDAEPDAWVDAVRAAQVSCSVEGVLLSDDVSTKATINQAIALRSELIAKYGRWVWFILAIQGMQEDEAQADYLVRMSTLQDGIAEKAIQLVPRLWGNDPAVLAGRLCNRAVTIADSPARVKTGALVSLGSDELPVDGAGEVLELATLQALEMQRFSVPMWYPDYDGFYWADGRTLDVEGGDYQSIETLRIADKAARRIRLLAIGKIADRALNSTPGSIAANQSLFMKPLREMSTAASINGVSFPGEVKPPQDGDVTIAWKSKKAVDIYIVVRTYEVPLQITINLMLDASLEATA
ncbi:phage tail protein [Klebsiella sp. STW0522-44]|nr:phage tail protein [Klebsiella sp. STW0522-44]